MQSRGGQHGRRRTTRGRRRNSCRRASLLGFDGFDFHRFPGTQAALSLHKLFRARGSWAYSGRPGAASELCKTERKATADKCCGSHRHLGSPCLEGPKMLAYDRRLRFSTQKRE